MKVSEEVNGFVINDFNYYRRLSPKLILKIWTSLETINALDTNHTNEEQMRQLLVKQLVTNCPDIGPKEAIDVINTAIEDKLVLEIFEYKNKDIEDLTEELLSDKELIFRYYPNYERRVFDRLTHDWYCFVCHSMGSSDDKPLIHCSRCWRSYHNRCLKPGIKSNDEFVCNSCIEITDSEEVNQLSDEMVYQLIKYVWNSVEEYSGVKIDSHFTITEDLKNRILIFKSCSMDWIHMNGHNTPYSNFQSFVNNWKHFVHNYYVSHPIYDSLLQFIDTRFDHEFKELKICVNCYQFTNNRDPENNWFIKVCDKPHEIVFADGWPAKVLSVSGDYYEVRNFDPTDPSLTPDKGFTRSKVRKRRIKSIDGYKSIGLLFNKINKSEEKCQFISGLALLSKHLKLLIESQNKSYETTVQKIDTFLSTHQKGSIKGQGVSNSLRKESLKLKLRKISNNGFKSVPKLSEKLSNNLNRNSIKRLNSSHSLNNCSKKRKTKKKQTANKSNKRSDIKTNECKHKSLSVNSTQSKDKSNVSQIIDLSHGFKECLA